MRYASIIVILVVALGATVSAEPIESQTGLSRNDKISLINHRLQEYNRDYPEIHFLHVAGGMDWRSELVTLFSLLGDSASYLDYQYPADMHNEVFNVSLARLARMLEFNIVSASLYRKGDNGLLEKPEICIITLNPDAFANDNQHATHYMMDLDDIQMSKVHPARWLEAKDHLRFTIDHEAYHCIDSHYNGGVPMTTRWFGGEYHHFRRESAADAYALAVHLRTHGRITPYARNITLIRAVWLFAETPDRCTFKSMAAILRNDIDLLMKMSRKQVLDFVGQTRDEAVGGYNDYVRQEAIAYKAAQQLKLKPTRNSTRFQKLEEIKTDPQEIDYRIRQYQYYFDRLFDDHPVEFKLSDAP